MAATKPKPDEVRDFTYYGATLHGIVEAVDGDQVTLKSTTGEVRLTVPIGDVGAKSGAGWFDLHAQLADEQAARAEQEES